MKDGKWENWSGFLAAKVFARLAKVLIFQFSYPRKSMEFFLVFKLVTERGFDIFSGRTLLNWQARFFDHFFIPRAHEFSNGSIGGKCKSKGVWKKKITRSLHNFKPNIEIPIFITYFHTRKTKQDRNMTENTVGQKRSHFKYYCDPSSWKPCK